MAEQRKGKEAIGTTLQGIGPSYSSKILRFALRVGDLVNWDLFVDKYNKFIEQAKYQFHVEEFDSEAELKVLKELRDRLVGGGMIVDSIDFIH